VPVLTVMVSPPLPPLVPPASVAQPLSEKSGSLPPRQLGSPPVVLALPVVLAVVVFRVVVVSVLVSPPALVEVETPPLPALVFAVVPPAPPELVVSEVLAPPLPEPPVLLAVLVDVVLEVVSDALLVEAPVVALALVLALVTVPLVVAAAVVPPPLVLAAVSDVELPPPPSVPALQAARHAASHGVTQCTSVRECVSMVALMPGSGASITKSTPE
jgi:hypothetical protein